MAETVLNSLPTMSSANPIPRLFELLAEKLRAFLGHAVKDNKLFHAHMATVMLNNRPPLGFFGRITGEKKGIHQGKFNIKLNGLGPIIDAARLSALERKVYGHLMVM